MTHTPLAGERLRPLGHVSVGASSDAGADLQAFVVYSVQSNADAHNMAIKKGLSLWLTLSSGGSIDTDTVSPFPPQLCIRIFLSRVYRMFARDLYRKRNKVGGMNVE